MSAGGMSREEESPAPPSWPARLAQSPFLSGLASPQASQSCFTLLLLLSHALSPSLRGKEMGDTSPLPGRETKATGKA